MKKLNNEKLIIISLVIMFVAVAAHGVYLSKTVNSLSNIVLANVEALAFREDDSKGVGTILTHDLGKGTKCEMVYFIVYISIVLIVLVKGHCHANQEHMSPFLQWENVMKSNLG